MFLWIMNQVQDDRIIKKPRLGGVLFGAEGNGCKSDEFADSDDDCADGHSKSKTDLLAKSVVRPSEYGRSAHIASFFTDVCG